MFLSIGTKQATKYYGTIYRQQGDLLLQQWDTCESDPAQINKSERQYYENSKKVGGR